MEGKNEKKKDFPLHTTAENFPIFSNNHATTFFMRYEGEKRREKVLNVA